MERPAGADQLAAAVEELAASHVQELRAAGRRNMLIGAVVCAVGLVITLASYAAASSGGGRYLVAWGAVLWGAIQFVRGLGQANR